MATCNILLEGGGCHLDAKCNTLLLGGECHIGAACNILLVDLGSLIGNDIHCLQE